MGLVWSSTLEGSNRRHVLVVIADRADDEGIAWPGVGYICRATGISRRQVFRIIEDLETEDWLVRDNTRVTVAGDPDTNLYQINLGKLRANQHAPIDYDADRRAKLARLAEARKRRSGGSDMVTPPPDVDAPTSPGGSDMVTPPPCHGVTTGGVTVTPNPSVDPPCDPKEGGAPTGVRHQREGTPASDDPPTPSLAWWQDPDRWHCRDHLALLADDPGADVPPCDRCRRVKADARPRFEAWQRELELAAAAERDEEADRERACRWHDATGFVELPVGPGERLPLTRCDHRTPPDVVADRLRAAAASAAPAIPSDDARRAARERGMAGARSTVPKPQKRCAATRRGRDGAPGRAVEDQVMADA